MLSRSRALLWGLEVSGSEQLQPHVGWAVSRRGHLAELVGRFRKYKLCAFRKKEFGRRCDGGDNLLFVFSGVMIHDIRDAESKASSVSELELSWTALPM
jgi:hypothetical protein